jgi:hypothetical protein
LHPSNQSNHIATADRCTPRRAFGGTHLLAALCAAFLVLGGCAGSSMFGAGLSSARDGLRPGGEPEPEAVSPRAKARIRLESTAKAVGWIAGIAAVAALGTFAASFIIPIVPRGLSGACLAAAVLGWVLSYAISAYGVWFAEIATWLSVGVGVFVAWSVGWPWAVALRNRSLAKLSTQLELEHPDAAVALAAAAGKLKTKAARKARLIALSVPKPA